MHTREASMSDTARRTPLRASAFQPAPAGETIHLQGRQHMKLRKAAGWHVKVLTGSLWITQDGDVRDIVLAAGDSVLLDRNALALFSSFGAASFRLSQDTSGNRHLQRHMAAMPPASNLESAAFA